MIAIRAALLAAVAACLAGLPPAAQAVSNEDCFDCHDRVNQAEWETYIHEDGDPPPFAADKFSESIHADMDCTDCHSAISDDPDHTEIEMPPVNCGDCHDDIQEEFQGSLHFNAQVDCPDLAPNCSSCHGTHDIFPSDDIRSRTHHRNEPKTCATCHENEQVTKDCGISMDHPYESYLMTSHGRTIMEAGPNAEKAAVCSDCHSAHNVRKRSDPASGLFKFNIPNTCGKCHEEEYEAYSESSHGKALADGILEAPSCTDCHGEHTIKFAHEKGSHTDAASVGLETCARCHDDSRIIQRFGLGGDKVLSFRESYHGLALRGGSAESANCASCHGYHNVRSADDPESTIHPANLPDTCGQCHPGVSEKVALGKVHVPPSQQGSTILRVIRLIYIPLILLTIGGMFFHNLLDFIRQELKHFDKSELTVQRFSLGQRIQHFLLLTSFFTLVITGFALKYPDAWWVQPFQLFPGAFALRGIVHRVAAVIMTALAAFHLGYLAFTKEGRRDFRLMLMGLQDLKDVSKNFLYFIGLSKEHPKFGRFSYMEKAEYWALHWGTFVMCLTGFLLWFEGFALKYFPKWVTDASTLIHFYEAILATLAILVWHFYYVIFNRHVYPLNRAMFVGKISARLEAMEHPREKEQLAKLENDKQ